MNDLLPHLRQALRDDDTTRARALLKRHPELHASINDPIEGFGEPAVSCARSPAMLDVLVDAGADLNAKSRWWAGGFGLLHIAPAELAAHAIRRGAVVDVHAAARLGFTDRVRELIAADPGLVHARGGDGQTPLHFASTVEIAEFLLDHGADIEARDVDHESTPAQYMVRDRQTVLRGLVRRGCRTDILMAAALGDLELVQRHLDADPESIRLRVSGEHFPMIGPKAGGSIYQWTLGWYVSAHQVARDFKHADVLQLLTTRSPDDVLLVAACWLHDEAAVKALLARAPGLAARLRDEDRRQLVHAARNGDMPAVRLFLEAGLPIDSLGQHGATPIHWAAWHGNVEMVRLLLSHHPPLEAKDADFGGTPLGWAIHASEHGWSPQAGDYAGTVKALLDGGASPPDKLAGTEAVRAELRGRGVTS